jgi:hypothetical protein
MPGHCKLKLWRKAQLVYCSRRELCVSSSANNKIQFSSCSSTHRQRRKTASATTHVECCFALLGVAHAEVANCKESQNTTTANGLFQSCGACCDSLCAMSWLGTGHVHGEHCKHGHGGQQQQQHDPALAHTIFAPPAGAEDLGPSQHAVDSVLTIAPGAESTDAGETEVCTCIW